MRRLLVIVTFLVGSVAPTYAFLPNTIETVIKSWFNGAGKFQCIKVSGGGVANCLYGANMTPTNGCSVSGGIMTCSGGFDATAATTTGSYMTWKEGSDNGTSTVRLQAPANLSTSRVNTWNADGTFKASDVATSNSSEYGRDALFDSSTGVLVGRANPTYIWMPDGSPALDPSGGVTATLTANNMRCATILARDSIVGATNLAHYVAVLGGSCSTCIYSEDGTTLIAPLVSGAPATASNCTGTGAKTMTGLDPFTLAKGTRYRLCTTSSSNLTQWFKGPYYASAVANMVTTTAGNAASTGTSGKCPTTTGALSAGDYYPPPTRVY